MSVRPLALPLLLLCLLGLASLVKAPSLHAQPPSGSPPRVRLDPIAHIGGTPHAVAVQGNHAYVGVGPSLHVLDISDPAHPVLVGQAPPFRAPINDVAVAGNYLYAVTGAPDNSLHILNISNAASPVEVGSFIASSGISSIDVAGEHAYVTYGGLHIIDVSNPARPRHLGNDDRPSFDVAVLGSYAYVASGEVLRVLDVTDPTQPVWLTFDDTPGEPQKVVVNGNYAYVTARRGWDLQAVNGLHIYDITTPAAPTRISSVSEIGMPQALAVTDDYAYVASSGIFNADKNQYEGGGLHIINVSDSVAPRVVGYYETEEYPRDIALDNDYLYFAADDLGIFNVSDPTTPEKAGSYQQMRAAEHITLIDDYIYVSSWVSGQRVVDVHNPSKPVEVARIDESEGWREMAVAGDYAYVTDRGRWEGTEFIEGGLHVLDVSNPADPIEVGFFQTPAEFWDIVVAGDYAYVASLGIPRNYNSREGGLVVIDVSDPAHPRQVGFHETPDRAYHIALAGEYAYLTGYPWGLRIYDIANPILPVETGALETEWGDIKIAGDYAYVIGGGLSIYDLRDPVNPERVGYSALQAGGGSLVVAGNRAFIAVWPAGVQIVDITNPTAPFLTNSYEIAGNTSDIDVDGDYVYIADGENGLYILRLVTLSESLYLPLLQK